MKEEKEGVNPDIPSGSPDSLHPIGRKLRAARLKKGRTIEAANQETRISKRFIAAMEEEHFDEIPAGSYLRSFLKGYCEYLDINFNEIWDLVCAQNLPGVSPIVGSQVAPSSPPEPPARDASRYQLPRVDINPKKIALGLGVLSMIILAIFMPRMFSAPKKQINLVAPEIPSSLKPIAPTENEESLVISFKRSVFLYVALDGHRHFSGRVLRGTRQTWTAHKEVTLWTKDPGALDLTLNGAPYQLSHPDLKGNYHISSGKNFPQLVFHAAQHPKSSPVVRKSTAAISLPVAKKRRVSPIQEKKAPTPDLKSPAIKTQ